LADSSPWYGSSLAITALRSKELFKQAITRHEPAVVTEVKSFLIEKGNPRGYVNDRKYSHVTLRIYVVKFKTELLHERCLRD